MVIGDAASRNIQAGLLVSAPYAAPQGLLSQNTGSRHAPIQAPWETQDAACSTPVAPVVTDTWTITVRNRWGERVYFAYRLLFWWPSIEDTLP